MMAIERLKRLIACDSEPGSVGLSVLPMLSIKRSCIGKRAGLKLKIKFELCSSFTDPLPLA